MGIIDELLSDVPSAQRQELERIRQMVHAKCPGVEEVKTYGMPGFKYKCKYLLAFANFNDHMSLFPGAEPVDALADDLKPYKTSKGTIQFTLDQPLTDDLLIKIIKLCKARVENATGSR